MEYIIRGLDVARWLPTTTKDGSYHLLIGYLFDDGVSDEDWHVQSVATDASSIVCGNGSEQKAIPIRRISSGDFLGADQELVDAVQASAPSFIRETDQLLDSLKALGVPNPGTRETDDLRALVVIAEDHRAERLPKSSQDRWSRYQLIKRLDLHRLGALICQKWLEYLEPKSGPFDPDLRIQAAYFLRHSGRTKEAIVVTNVLYQPRNLFPADDGQISVLSTMRSSSLLDLFEIDQDPARLIEAKKFLDRAWATKSSNIVSSVYQRYHKLAG
jgi:hypothetical protein